MLALVVLACSLPQTPRTPGGPHLPGPPARTPVWRASGEQDIELFGQDVAWADVDGDGFSDLLVSAPRHQTPPYFQGVVFCFRGTPNGPATVPSWRVHGSTTSELFGARVVRAGDVNGDGFDDVLVSKGGNNHREVLLFHGSATGLSPTPNWSMKGQSQDWFGNSIACAGDVNGDGFDDVIVGAQHSSLGAPLEGRALVYTGSVVGLSLTPAWIEDGHQDGARFGAWVASVGDVDGDGFDDVLVSASTYDGGEEDEGAVFVFAGSPSGPSHAPLWRFESDRWNARLGYNACTAGDVNGDGYADVMVGDVHYPPSNGHWYGNPYTQRVLVFLGSPLGPALAPSLALADPGRASYYGSELATGDVNGDGIDDLVVGAAWFTHDTLWEGRIFVYPGAPTGLAREPEWIAESDQKSCTYSTSIAADGDMNGDGLDDVAVGAPSWDSAGDDVGAAFVYAGRAALGVHYCVATSNSTGHPARMGARGSAVVADDDLTLEASSLPPGRFGTFLVSRTRDFVPHAGGAQGNLCLGPPIGRYAKDVADTGARGELALPIDLTLLPPPLSHAVASGETWHFSAWFRDANPMPTSNYSDGLSITFE